MTKLYDWNEPFGPTVVLRFGTPKKTTLAIRSTREMVLFLLEQWPGEKTEKFTTACRICRDAIRGTAQPESARFALIDAAVEARILDDLPFHPVEKSRPAA